MLILDEPANGLDPSGKGWMRQVLRDFTDRGGTVLLGHGAVTSFVPNPDHIHVTGVPAGRARAVSLHLYGRMMSSFNVYDVAAGTRRRIHVAHNES